MCFAASEHFIYIENQYFISALITQPDTRYQPNNGIAKAIHRRIRRAILEKQAFRVVIVIPVQ